MSKSLCFVCRCLDPDFFSSKYDNVKLPNRREVQHAPINWIKRSATSGCPLCTCLIASVSIDEVPPHYLEEAPVKLRRAIIDLDQAIAICVGLDDISNTFFSRVEQNWRFPSLARLEQPECNYEIMENWVKLCISRHSECSNGTASFSPTRLLDVKAFKNSQDVKLTTLHGDQIGTGYVALSHCWGSSMVLTTQKSNLRQHYQRIPFSDLTTTFKDAVNLTSDLGQRYLWIDSLCIIQDDQNDWIREASTMASVYKNGVFTLSALSSKDGTGGCRVRNPQARIIDNPYFDFDLGPHRIRIFKGRITPWHEEYGDDDTFHSSGNDQNPLRRRAWTLQERELSQRLIHFSENMILWECACCKASSEIPWREVVPVDDSKPLLLGCQGPDVLQESWYSLMEDYMSRALTKETDKLPALAGLAQDWQENWPSSRYFAGIWSTHLPHALLWRTGSDYSKSRSNRQSSYRAPSWSFLSLNGAISYESLRIARDGKHQSLTESNLLGLLDPVILNVDMNLVGIDKYSSIQDARLKLLGILRSLRIRRMVQTEEEELNSPSDNWARLETEDKSVVGLVYLDIEKEYELHSHIWCLYVQPEIYWSHVQMPYELYDFMHEHEFQTAEGAMIMGIALEQDGSTMGTFRRLGLIRWVKASLFSDLEPREVVLI